MAVLNVQQGESLAWPLPPFTSTFEYHVKYHLHILDM